MSKEKKDFIIIGGGLSGCLALHCLRYHFPQKSTLLIEKSANICSPHTWSFHDTDIPNAQKKWLTPLISCSWDQYRVVFPDYERTLSTKYHSIRSEDLAQKTLAIKSSHIEIVYNTNVQITSPTSITIDEDIITAGLVIDARGWGPLTGPLGYQKFFGCEVELETPHKMNSPLLKDARIPQTDGYRFMYVLPWDANRLLIEDTYYSNNPELDFKNSESEILNYANAQGWIVKNIISREHGTLPLVLSSQYPSLTTITIGAKSCFYQPVTGYTFPQTMQCLEWLTANLKKSLSSQHLYQQELKWLKKNKWKQSIYLFLNRMLFLSSYPDKRYKILQRFYKFSPLLIHRFYAGQSSIFDIMRILIGKPPVPLHRVPKALFSKLDQKASPPT